MRVMTVFGTRPEAIKMAPVIKALKDRPDDFESNVCVTGQHREMLDQVLRLFEIEPDYDLNIMSPNQTLAGITSKVLTELDPILEEAKPDWVLVQGDTTTAMTASLAAFYRQVKVGHIEAGLRTNDKLQPFPEEINRRITSVVADLHFAPTEWAANNLRREGHREDQIVVTGNTVIDAIQSVADQTFNPNGHLPESVIHSDKRIILVTAHRRENIGKGIDNICSALRAIVADYDDVHVVFPVHLNPQVHGPVYARLAGSRKITLLPPLDYQPLVWLIKQCHFVISDSGGIQEEAPGLGKPVLVLRETTERPEGVHAGTVKLVGTDPDSIVANARILLEDPDSYARMACARNPYGSGHAALAIRDSILASRPVRFE